MTGAVVHFSEGLEVDFGFIFVSDWPSVAEVFGTFGFEKTFTWPLKGQVRVLHRSPFETHRKHEAPRA